MPIKANRTAVIIGIFIAMVILLCLIRLYPRKNPTIDAKKPMGEGFFFMAGAKTTTENTEAYGLHSIGSLIDEYDDKMMEKPKTCPVKAAGIMLENQQFMRRVLKTRLYEREKMLKEQLEAEKLYLEELLKFAEFLTRLIEIQSHALQTYIEEEEERQELFRRIEEIKILAERSENFKKEEEHQLKTMREILSKAIDHQIKIAKMIGDTKDKIVKIEADLARIRVAIVQVNQLYLVSGELEAAKKIFQPYGDAEAAAKIDGCNAMSASAGRTNELPAKICNTT